MFRIKSQVHGIISLKHTCLEFVEFIGEILEILGFFDSELVLGLLAGNIGLCWLVVTVYKNTIN